MGNIKNSVKSARKCENLNDPVDNYVIDYIAMVFSKLFIKLHIIPNVVTLLSGLVGIAGGIMLMFGNIWLNIAGVLLIILAAVFDASDGQVARLTKKYSNLGRTLDGLCDCLVYLSIYVALCVRLFNVNIPFTETPWGWWIVLVAAICFYFYGAQSRTVDYYKNLHMYMYSMGKSSELSRSEEIKKQIAETKKFSFERFRLKMYLLYTNTQEKEAPQTQKLLKGIESSGDVPEAASQGFLSKSRKYVKFTNLLTFNLRTFVLFILLFLPGHMEFYYFPFVLFVLEPVRIALIVTYEKLSKKIYKETFIQPTETNK